jgi:hypothetical protein
VTFDAFRSETDLKRCLAILTFVAAIGVTAAQAPPPLHWYKGNLHTHTINSDGDSPPADVVAWYKRNGYQFLAITDHNMLTDPRPFDSDGADDFLLIAAEEVGRLDDRPIHVNALGINKVIPPSSAVGATEILRANLDAVRRQNAIPLINHPNFHWAFTAVEMLPLTGPFLVEIASGHPDVNSAGDSHTPSTEEMWDQLLSAGVRAFGAAVDDAHHFRGDVTIDQAAPGRCWVVVRAPSLTRNRILAALNSGEFYASSGIVLKDVIRTRTSLTVEIDPDVRARAHQRVVFVGSGGRVLAISNENPARYNVLGNEGYVRARVEDSRGRRAWTQPVFVSQ